MCWLIFSATTRQGNSTELPRRPARLAELFASRQEAKRGPGTQDEAIVLDEGACAERRRSCAHPDERLCLRDLMVPLVLVAERAKGTRPPDDEHDCGWKAYSAAQSAKLDELAEKLAAVTSKLEELSKRSKGH